MPTVQNFCWCVQLENGEEIYGTKVTRSERARISCKVARRCPSLDVECLNPCPYGRQTDEQGCPLASCACRDLCSSVRCDNPADQCQLVEPDCANPPCMPVPRCLLNPCPNGLPMTLQNGVTALCTQSAQCFDNFWCHKVGYNGLGFCCPAPESATRAGTCEAKVPHSLPACPTECKADADCGAPGKCCFDGCGLRCTTVAGAIVTPKPASPVRSQPVYSRQDVLRSNKALLTGRLATCYHSGDDKSRSQSVVCETECRSDDDCTGLKKCCTLGCSRVCSYPHQTTQCLHTAITHDIFRLPHSPKCDSQGDFEEVQCSDQRCYCADKTTGEETPRTVLTTGRTPSCDVEDGPTCPEQGDCPQSCPYGFERDPRGCPTCDCRNPCRNVRCPESKLCVMMKVECIESRNCQPQPRCVINACRGRPLFIASGMVEQCATSCANGYWCNNIGLPGLGGICCSEGISSNGGVKPEIHAGRCPQIQALYDVSRFGSGDCRLQCRSDAECATQEKCCINFDGCGTSCLVMNVRGTEQRVTEAGETLIQRNKVGECPATNRRRDCRSGFEECVQDSDCPGIRKCCSDGCFHKCVFAEVTTACLHHKAALEAFGRNTLVKCTTAGEYVEVQCDNRFCWCVDGHGEEIEGTRTTDGQEPNCKERSLCREPGCPSSQRCPYGYEKDSHGCNTCQCINPCKGLTCPEFGHVCVPSSMKCLSGKCPSVPKCAPNACLNGKPLVSDLDGTPLSCHHDAQCPPNGFCRRYTITGGYCCPSNGAASLEMPGICPAMSVFDESNDANVCQSLQCQSDTSCGVGQKCCFNGCGLSCLPANSAPNSKDRHQATSVNPRIADASDENIRIGECPRIANLSDVGYKKCKSFNDGCAKEASSRKFTDDDCRSPQLCCFDGCAMACLNPQRTTACVHQLVSVRTLKRMAAISATEFEPRCNTRGTFSRVQRYAGFSWCTDSRGMELPGTRVAAAEDPDCENPRSCPVLPCPNSCPYGFLFDATGCPTCMCRQICLGVQCPSTRICTALHVDCTDEGCQPVPKCVPNMCPSGAPLEDRLTQEMISCNEHHGPACPAGFFCHRFGMNGMGYCCAGLVPQVDLLPSTRCPDVPILEPTRSSASHLLECRMSMECPNRSPCCFNGVTTFCATALARTAPTRTGPDPTPAQRQEHRTPERPNVSQENRHTPSGSCPANTFTNPGCRSDCSSDDDCGKFQRCCEYGCGRKCFYPLITTPCVHQFSSYEHEAQKSSEKAEIIRRASVSCSSDGLFQAIQCNRITEQCWCVERRSGIEIIGTRTNISRGDKPECHAPRMCSKTCDSSCEHGVSLDLNGCPKNGCRCKNPCEDFQCVRHDEVCVPKPVECTTRQCPPKAMCIPSVCSKGSDALKDPRGHNVVCASDDDCQPDGQCVTLGENQKLGLCCVKGTDSTRVTALVKPGVCPAPDIQSSGASETCVRGCRTDSDCTGVAKCCTLGCSHVCLTPLQATNCINLFSAVERLRWAGASVKLPTPTCDPHSGQYARTQCDAEGYCWCVDGTTGVEQLGTRAFQPTNDMCRDRRPCPIICEEARASACPFGLDTDSAGCPKTSACRCRNLCDEIQCSRKELCVMRPTICQDDACRPIPTCERNPCSSSASGPAFDLRTFVPFTCFHNHTQICPSGYYCTSYDENGSGLCCSGQEPAMQTFADDDKQCPHGAPLVSEDDSPQICSTSADSSECPRTHYCSTKAGQSKGFCCPTKRHACNLPAQQGSCAHDHPRFYFDYADARCKPFAYSGCAGNENNFVTESECQTFCAGEGVTDTVTMAADEGGRSMPDLYNVGFSLSGPLLRPKHDASFNDAIRTYMIRTYGLREEEIRDLFSRDDNTVRFSIMAPDAQQKAQNISDAVSDGQFRFTYHGDTFKAEPHTVFSRQISTHDASSAGSSMFWALLVASIIFAFVVIFALCYGCAFLRKRRKIDDGSIYRSTSPDPYGQISAYARRNLHVTEHHTTTTNRRRPTKNASEGDLNRMRQNVVGGGNLLSPMPSDAGQHHSSPASSSSPTHSTGDGAQSRNPRKSSRTTLYY